MEIFKGNTINSGRDRGSTASKIDKYNNSTDNRYLSYTSLQLCTENNENINKGKVDMGQQSGALIE